MSFDRTNTWGNFSFESVYGLSFRDSRPVVEIPQCWNSKRNTMFLPPIDWPEFMELEELTQEEFDFFSMFKSYTPAVNKPQTSDLNLKCTPLTMYLPEMMQKIYYDAGTYVENGCYSTAGRYYWWAEPDTINDQIPDKLIMPDTFLEYWPTCKCMDYTSRTYYFADKCRIGPLLQGLCDLLEKMIYLVSTNAKITPLDREQTGYISYIEHYNKANLAQCYLCKKFQATPQLPESQRLWPSYYNQPTSNFGESEWNKEWGEDFTYLDHRFGNEITGYSHAVRREGWPWYDTEYWANYQAIPPYYDMLINGSWYPKNTVFLGETLTNSTAWDWHIDKLYSAWDTTGDTEVHWDYSTPGIPQHLTQARYYNGKPTEETTELSPNMGASIRAQVPEINVGRLSGSAHSSLAYVRLYEYNMIRQQTLNLRIEGDNAEQVKIKFKVIRSGASLPAYLYLSDSTDVQTIDSSNGISYLEFTIDIDATNGYTDCNFILEYDSTAFNEIWAEGYDTSNFEHKRTCTWDVESNYTPGIWYSGVTKTPYGSGYRVNKCTLYGMRHPALYQDGEPGWWLGEGSNRTFDEDKLFVGTTCKKTGQTRETFAYQYGGMRFNRTYDLATYQLLRPALLPMQIQSQIYKVCSGCNDSISISVYSWEPIVPD